MIWLRLIILGGRWSTGNLSGNIIRQLNADLTGPARTAATMALLIIPDTLINFAPGLINLFQRPRNIMRVKSAGNPFDGALNSFNRRLRGAPEKLLSIGLSRRIGFHRFLTTSDSAKSRQSNARKQTQSSFGHLHKSHAPLLL